MSEVIVIDSPELMALPASKADQIRKTFEPMAKMISAFEEQYNALMMAAANEGINEDIVAAAKRLRLDMAKVRVATDKVRVAEKQESLLAGRAIDGVGNILKWAVSDKEAKLKEVEDHFENLEKKRIEDIQAERVALLSLYVEL